ncbi:LacI family DNA-binding transcriptional regulator [Sandaracinobacter neustonicus]|uniref:LacI family DNA-binding transcriptional regulator n=1 Tax=Sandaracinobacter neustonicus TaxID=1715348 RepID=UPI001F2BC2BF|nr:substrate-binding domain-containing protein [Sandaracinobacter neustonicus]
MSASVRPDRAPTSFDIAHLAGVTQPTVSRALSGSPMVSEATRKRIEAIARQLNYKVDKAASSLRKRRSDTLALLFFEDPTADESLINPFFVAMLGSITRAAKRAGYDLLVSFQQLSDDWHKDYEDSHKADGLILLGYGDWEIYRERVAQLSGQGTRFARWGSVEAAEALHGLGSTIGSDNRTGGEMAARHLIGLGRKCIAFLGHASSHYPEFLARFEGIASALAAAGLPPPLQADAITTEDAGAAAVHALLASGQPFDSIVAASDLIAIGAMRALEELGLNVPTDVAITGFDDIPAAVSTRPPLTTVVQDTQRAGQLLVDSVRAQLEGLPAPGAMLPTRLVIRRSCGSA